MFSPQVLGCFLFYNGGSLSTKNFYDRGDGEGVEVSEINVHIVNTIKGTNLQMKFVWTFDVASESHT